LRSFINFLKEKKMKTPDRLSRLLALLILLAAVGCNVPDSGAIQTQTMAALNTMVVATQTALANQALATSTLPLATSASQDTPQSGDASPTAPPGLVGTPTPTPIVHVITPAEPGYLGFWIYDHDSSTFADQKRTAGGDLYLQNMLERPFTKEMNYRPDLDVVRGDLTLDSTFYYVLITLQGINPTTGTLSASYAVELDTDIDGRGDFIIWAFAPLTTQWNTLTVRAYDDTNNDVGGPSPLNSDAPFTTGDGYDRQLFSVEIPVNPDLAWARISPTNPKQIQIAFQKSLVGNAATFLWGVMADDGLKDPSRLDYNDIFTFDQAGSPYTSLAQYPLKDLPLVDNTCRIAQGFVPTGSEPGLCALPTATPVPVPGSIHGRYWWDINTDGIRQASEVGAEGGHINLGLGACNSTGYASTTTTQTGHYSFSNLAPGTYCVSHEWTQVSTTPKFVTVTVVSGVEITVNFGIARKPPTK
jgi:hypothetical protein